MGSCLVGPVLAAVIEHVLLYCEVLSSRRTMLIESTMMGPTHPEPKLDARVSYPAAQAGALLCLTASQPSRCNHLPTVIFPKPGKTHLWAVWMFSKEIPNGWAGCCLHSRVGAAFQGVSSFLPPGNGSVWAHEIPDVLRSRVADGIMIFQILMNILTELVHFTVCSSIFFPLPLPPSPLSPSLCSSHTD